MVLQLCLETSSVFKYQKKVPLGSFYGVCVAALTGHTAHVLDEAEPSFSHSAGEDLL